MKYIQPVNSYDGRLAMVDDKDYPKLSQLTWRVDKSGYLYTSHLGKLYSMHKLVYGLEVIPKGHHIDHINRNTFDNRRSNLRLIDSLSNMYNRGKRVDSQHEYKGIQRRAGTEKYRASIQYYDIEVKKTVRVFSPYTLSLYSAVVYYNILSNQYHGDYSCANQLGNLHQLYYPCLCM